MRAPGMTWARLPLFVWGMYATALIQVLATPVLAITLLLLIARALLRPRHLRPEARRRPGALPALLLVLLAPGRLHHDRPGDGHHQRAHRDVLAARRSSATSFIAMSSLGLALLGFLVWGHHMFVSGHERVRDDGVLGADVPRRHPERREGLQLDRDAVQGVDLARRRRCSTRWRSSSSSPSAA